MGKPNIAGYRKRDVNTGNCSQKNALVIALSVDESHLLLLIIASLFGKMRCSESQEVPMLLAGASKE